MAKAELITQETSTTAIGGWYTWVTNEIKSDYGKINLAPDEYSLQCGQDAITALVDAVEGSKDIDNALLSDPAFRENLRTIVRNCAALKLSPAHNEVYFTPRNVQIGGKWTKRFEMGVQSDGFETLVRNFGDNVKEIGVAWEVKETDDFTFPVYNGSEVTPPVWQKKMGGKKCMIVVYPVTMKNRTVVYSIVERDDVMSSLFAHVKSNLLNTTFGLAESKYKASKEVQEQIEEKKREILDGLKKCQTIDEMVDYEPARKYMSPAWIDSTESMIIRKMKNKALKRFKLNFNTMQNTAFNETDEVYKAAHMEIEQNENQADFFIEGEVKEL